MNIGSMCANTLIYSFIFIIGKAASDFLQYTQEYPLLNEQNNPCLFTGSFEEEAFVITVWTIIIKVGPSYWQCGLTFEEDDVVF